MKEVSSYSLCHRRKFLLKNIETGTKYAKCRNTLSTHVMNDKTVVNELSLRTSLIDFFRYPIDLGVNCAT